MKTLSGVITRVLSEFGHLSAEISGCGNLVLGPGQYLDISPAGQRPALPQTYFPSRYSDGLLTVSAIPESWLPGMELVVRGPFGNGFQAAASVQKLCLAAWDSDPLRLVWLLRQAVIARREVILVLSKPLDPLSTPDIPEDVEILAPDQFGDAMVWADYIAMDCPLEQFARVRPFAAALRKRLNECPVQVLVRTPFPCLGIAECGICAVPSKKGYRLACKDGPVFNFSDLDWE